MPHSTTKKRICHLSAAKIFTSIDEELITDKGRGRGMAKSDRFKPLKSTCLMQMKPMQSTVIT